MVLSCFSGCLPLQTPWARDDVYPKFAAVAACRALAASSRVERLLASESADERLRGLRLLQTLQPGDAARHAARTVLLLEDAVWTVRHAASDVLLGDVDGLSAGMLVAAPGLATALRRLVDHKDKDPDVRLAAAATLSRSDGARDERTSALLSDRTLVLQAVGRVGESFRFASAALRADRDVALLAVRQRGSALRHASEGLRDDPSLVACAVAAPGGGMAALRFASEEIREHWYVRHDLQRYSALVDHWQRTEDAAFPAKSSSAKGDDAYAECRPALAARVLQLAEDLESPACFGKAMALLDSLALVKPSVCTGPRRLEVAAAAVLTAIKLGRRRFQWKGSGPVLAAFVGEPEYSPAVGARLQKAQTFLLSTLNGRVALPSVADWVDVFVARLVMGAPREGEGDLLQSMAEAPGVREVAGAAKLQRKEAGSEPGSDGPPLWSAASTAVPMADSDSDLSGSPWESEPPEPLEASGGPQSGPGACRLSGALAGDFAFAARAQELARRVVLQVAAAAEAPPCRLAAAVCLCCLVDGGAQDLRSRCETERLTAALEECGLRPASTEALSCKEPELLRAAMARVSALGLS